MGGTFLNVDVEVRAGTDLAPLLPALGADINLMYCGEDGPDRFLLSFELSGSASAGDEPDAIASGLCTVLEQLPADARARWDTADDRVFDVGYDPSPDRQTGQPLLTASTMRRISDLNGRLAVSIYWRDDR